MSSVRTAAFTFAALIIVLVSARGSAVAAEAPPRDPTARAEWYSAKAEEAFQAKKFSEAIKLYLDAYESAPSASILYNVAFIYDKRLDDAELAIDYYERAASAADADKSLSDKARARVKALRAELDKPPDKPPGDKPPDKPPGDKPPDKPPHDPDPETTSSFPVGPVVTMAAGGVVLATGIVFGILAQGTEGDFEGATTAAAKKDYQSSGRTEALVADLGMALGGAALVGGVLWFFLDTPSEPDDEGQVTPLGKPGLELRPALGPGHAGLSLGGTF